MPQVVPYRAHLHRVYERQASLCLTEAISFASLWLQESLSPECGAPCREEEPGALAGLVELPLADRHRHLLLTTAPGLLEIRVDGAHQWPGRPCYSLIKDQYRRMTGRCRHLPAIALGHA